MWPHVLQPDCAQNKWGKLDILLYCYSCFILSHTVSYTRRWNKYQSCAWSPRNVNVTSVFSLSRPPKNSTGHHLSHLKPFVRLIYQLPEGVSAWRGSVVQRGYFSASRWGGNRWLPPRSDSRQCCIVTQQPQSLVPEFSPPTAAFLIKKLNVRHYELISKILSIYFGNTWSHL